MPIGKFWRQRFGEKGKRSFIQKLHNLGSGRFLPQSPSLLEHPEKNPAALCQTSPRLHPEFLLPFKNTVLWELPAASA